MPTNLDYGYKKPNSGEAGNIFCPVLEDDLEQLSTHDHDGVNSALISTSDLNKNTVTLVIASWVASDELYYQTVEFPTGYNHTNCMITAKIVSGSSEGSVINPTIVKTDATHFNLFVNDNSADVKVSSYRCKMARSGIYSFDGGITDFIFEKQINQAEACNNFLITKEKD